MQSYEGNLFVEKPHQKFKKVNMAMFRFELQEGQVDAFLTLIYEQIDLLLLANTGFGKSHLFQIMPFIFNFTGVVIILMSLKLL